MFKSVKYACNMSVLRMRNGRTNIWDISQCNYIMVANVYVVKDEVSAIKTMYNR
jgi:hypothetical protein